MSESGFFVDSVGLSVGDIVALTGAEPRDGTDLARSISDLAPLDRAGIADLSFIAETKYAGVLAQTRAGAVLTSERFAELAPANVAVLRIAKPYEAFVAVARRLYPSALRPTSLFGSIGVAPGAIVHPSAKLAAGVTVDPGAVIGPRAEIGAGSLIGANAVIGPHVKIGADCAIGAGCTVTHSEIGDRVIVHPGCQIGQDGFGYISSAQGHTKVPQIGRVVIHDDVEIGAGSNVDRGGMRDTVIGQGTKIDNLCQIGHNCVIGRHCIIVAQSGLSGSVTVEDFAVLGARTGVIPHITIGKGAMLASRSTVYSNVPAGAVWGGFPAQSKRQWMREVVALRQLAARDQDRAATPATSASPSADAADLPDQAAS
ncbi:MAG TPA: UDP-3-O-(3-hydroxymyristoyl)glucosamine N-acyltransferase [Rhodopseudomonas sp.]|uniref:UDP-3-O-(3-hydroxymyristoyl)glucosamine N-acyltransferase n=1 Tax=Rhodopseudomonas sp. TaxID=1078 RepID=UPI002EDB08CA